MSKTSKYTKEVLQEALKNALCMSDVVRNLGIRVTGSSHRHITQRVKKFNLDTTHFDYKKVRSTSVKQPHDKILVYDKHNGRREVASQLRYALIKSGIEEKCVECGIKDFYNNKPIRLQVDHINGNGVDNRPENLRFLCPNCHSQTDNFGSKNIDTKPKIKKEKRLQVKELKEKQTVFGPKLDKRYGYKERPNQRKVERPSKLELEKLIWEKSTVQLAKEFGVSDKAIEKWCKSYNISKPPRGYWSKKDIN